VERRHLANIGESVPDRPMVLMVETDSYIRHFASYFLHEGGYEVNCADDGYAALDRVRLDSPALIITELMLPHLDGLALCRLLKADPATAAVPILVFSALSADVRALESGANAFIMKPIEKIALLNMVNSLVPSKLAGENS